MSSSAPCSKNWQRQGLDRFALATRPPEIPVREERRRYTISVAAELVGVHQQTIRHYERLGLISPQRGKGDIRYFSPTDIERTQQIRRLVDELGVNLAGVEVVLNMREQMREMQDASQRELAEVRAQYEQELGRLKEIIRRLQGT